MLFRDRLRHEDFVGGVTTFLAMAYVVVVNPQILSKAGMPFAGVMTATVLLAALGSYAMGRFADLPFGVAPGMGVNAFFTFTLVLGQGLTWQAALGTVFWAGVVFLVMGIGDIRGKIVDAIPHSLQIGSAAGIGLFIAFIGLKNAGVVSANAATLVSFGGPHREQLLFGIGFLLAAVLTLREWRGAFLLTIAAVTLLSIAIGLTAVPQQVVALPDFSLIGALDIWGALKPEHLGAIVSITFTDLFDSVSTFMGVTTATMITLDRKRNLRPGLTVDSLATLFAGILGTSSGTAYIESAAGIRAGGRSGNSAIITGFCFLPMLFFSPLAAIVPPQATGAVLFVIGATMLRSIKQLESKRLEEYLPALVAAIITPLTFSITNGLVWGFITHTALFVAAGRAKEVSLPMYLLSLCSVGLLLSA